MKRLTSLLLAAALCLSLIAAVSATEYQSAHLSYGTEPYRYDLWSSLYVDGTQFRAATWVEKVDRMPAPAGYMGAHSRLYSNSTGRVVAETGWVYNSSNEYFIFPTTRSVNRTGESLYSCGEVTLYSANTYNRLDTPGSPSQGRSAFSPELLATLDRNQRYPVNQQGRTYGSALLSDLVGCEPDLISAEGTDGVCGYVLSHDLSPDITTPEEAIAYMAAFEDRRVLPLYDLNETVIGTFVLELGIDPESSEFKGCDLAAAQAKVESGAYTEPPAITQLPKSPGALSALAAQPRSCYYPENSAGLTYGSSAVAGAVGHQPDLIAVITTDGKDGYVRREDLDDPVIRTPEEAAAYMRSQEAGPTLIPVYDLDGLEIGQFLRG